MNVLNIQTKYLGNMEIEESKIIHFPSGIPGFLDELDFVLLDIPGNPIFQFLQSLKSEELAFVVVNPYQFHKEYTIELDESTINSLEIKSEKDVLILTIVTVKEPFETSTMNLKAPIVINLEKMLGKQYILNTDEYQSKASLKTATAQKGV